MELTTSIDERIYNTLQDNTSDEKFKYYLNIFQMLNLVNESKLLNKLIDIASVENTLINYLTNDNVKPIDFPMVYEKVLGDTLQEFLDFIGISVVTDKLFILVDITSTLLFLEQIDTAFLNTLYSILNNGEIEAEEVIADLVDTVINGDYESGYKSEYEEAIEAVDESLLTTLRLYCGDRLEETEAFDNKDIFLLTRIDKLGLENIDLALFQYWFKNLPSDLVVLKYLDLYISFSNYYKMLKDKTEFTLDNIVICILDCYFCSKEFKDNITLEELLENETNLEILELNDLQIAYVKDKLISKYKTMEINHD